MPDKYPILQFFRYQHLPAHLQPTSRAFCELANQLADQLSATDHPAEVAAGLRHMLEAKDCFVRAALPQVRD